MDLDGNAIFGRSVTCAMEQEPSEVQLNSFFGLSGVLSLWGGGRGRMFMVSGILAADNLADLAALRANFLSYDDGIARTLTDTWGVSWPQVVFVRWQQEGRVVAVPGVGWGVAYKAVFRGLV